MGGHLQTPCNGTSQTWPTFRNSYGPQSNPEITNTIIVAITADNTERNGRANDVDCPRYTPLLQDLHILDLYGLNITRTITLSLKLLERPWNIIAFYTFSCDMRPECLKYYRTLNIYFLIWLICWCCLPFHLVLHFLMEGRDIRLLNNSLVSQCMLRHLAMSEYHPGCLEHARLSYLANNILKYRGYVSLDGGVLWRFQW